MAHFARLNTENFVTEVIVVSNEVLIDGNGKEDENLGVEYCKKLFGEDTNWVQTSYNNSFRKKYAGRGFFYDKEIDAFIPPKPYPSWVYDNESGDWIPPVEKPKDQPRMLWEWDENLKNWKPNFF